MGHTNADVTLNVYTQAMDDALRTAVIASETNCSRVFTLARRNWLIREAT